MVAATSTSLVGTITLTTRQDNVMYGVVHPGLFAAFLVLPCCCDPFFLLQQRPGGAAKIGAVLVPAEPPQVVGLHFILVGPVRCCGPGQRFHPGRGQQRPQSNK
jgi:hypothetical protein